MTIPRILMTVIAAMIADTCEANMHLGQDTIARHRNAAIESGLGIKLNASLVKTRARLLKQGWQPIQMHSGGNYEYDGAEKRLVGRGFMEVDSCSADAGANCILYYRRGHTCLRLDTVGEQVDWMKVRRWTAECPSSTE